jgi:hypothetical protein
MSSSTKIVSKVGLALAMLLVSVGVAAFFSPGAALSAPGAALSAPSSARVSCSYVLSFKNRATGGWLDSNSAGEVYSIAGNGGNHQKWCVTSDAHLRNVATDRCLDNNEALGRVTTSPCQSSNGFQKWFVNGVTVSNQVHGTCMDDNRALGRIVTGFCEGGNRYQQWEPYQV